MSLDPAAILSLKEDLKAAKVACGAVANPALDALCEAEAAAISAFILKATLVPALTSAPGGGPVVGTVTIT